MRIIAKKVNKRIRKVFTCKDCNAGLALDFDYKEFVDESYL